MVRSFSILFWALASVALGAPAGYYGERADGFRPRCVAKSDSRDNVFFTWNESEKTERKIWARLRRLPCDRWSRAIGPLSTRTWVTVLPAQDTVFGVRLDANTREALRQVRYGAQEIRKEATAVEWLRHHPISKFTYELNRNLTQRFGMGFSGDVYHAWIESSPENQHARDRYRFWFKTALNDPSASVQTLRKKMHGRKILFSLGMGWNPDNVSPGGDVNNFVKEVGVLGADVVILKNHPYEDLHGNVGILREQLDRELSKGTDVILVGLCKGSVELLAAYSAVTRGYLDSDRTQRLREPGRGRVLAYLNLSGLMGGTFLGDVLEHVPGHEHVASVLRDEFTGTKQEIGHALSQLPSMSFEATEKFNRATWRKGLPSDSLYFSVIGIPPEKGYSFLEGPFIKGIRKWTRRLHLTTAANDGYIDYPRQEIPEGTGSQQFTVVLPSSHMLWDGVFAGEIMNTSPSRKALMAAMFLTTLDLTP